MTPLIIQQSAGQAALAFELHTHAEIDSVRLRRARLSSRSLLDAVRGPIVLEFSHKARQARGPEGVLRLEIDFRFRGEQERALAEREARSAREPLVLVECTWEVDYRLANGYQPAPKAVQAFKDGNGIFNCWPYFREYLQNTVTRMNLPPLTVPLLRLLPKPPRGKAAERQSE
jgi:hypothetical protein